MLKICYILANLCEMTLGIVILNKIYPEFRFKSGVMKGLAIVLFCVAGFLYAGNAWLFLISTKYSGRRFGDLHWQFYFQVKILI